MMSNLILLNVICLRIGVLPAMEAKADFGIEEAYGVISSRKKFELNSKIVRFIGC